MITSDFTFLEILNKLKEHAGVNQTDDLVNLINNTIEINQDSIKTNLITTLNNKLGTNMTIDTAWPAILSEITTTDKVKKWATGISSNNTVTGLNFMPSLVVCLQDSVTPYKVGVSAEMLNTTMDNWVFRMSSSQYASNAYSIALREDGFTWSYSSSYKWIAFE